MSERPCVWRWLVVAALQLTTTPVFADIDAEAGPPDHLRITREWSEHTFVSPDLASLREALRASPRFGGHGQTVSSFELAQQLYADASGCRLIDHQLQVRIVVHLPRWQPPRPLAEQEQGNWPQALAALRSHETGHAAHAEQAAQVLDTRLQALRGKLYSGCPSLQRTIDRMRIRTLTQLELQDSLYDQVTDFGRLDVEPPKPARVRSPRRGPRDRAQDAHSPDSDSVRMRRT